VLEAMAMAKPVVASAAAAEGIAAKDKRHFRIAKSVEQEAKIISELLADNDARLVLGQAARAHVIDHYGWDRQLAGLDQILQLNPNARHPRECGGPSPDNPVSNKVAL
jgi:polysaccharide biosynthesis protein PslH